MVGPEGEDSMRFAISAKAVPLVRERTVPSMNPLDTGGATARAQGREACWHESRGRAVTRKMIEI